MMENYLTGIDELITMALAGETEAGSAGTQPARDSRTCDEGEAVVWRMKPPTADPISLRANMPKKIHGCQSACRTRERSLEWPLPLGWWSHMAEGRLYGSR